MKKYCRPLIATFFLVLALVPLGFTIFSTVRHHTIHREREQRFATQPLTTIVLTASGIHWLERNELWVDNQLFDVKTSEEKNGLFFFTGIYDEEETSLVEKEKEAARNKGYNNGLLTLYEYLSVFYPPSPSDMGWYVAIANRYAQKKDLPVYRPGELLRRPPRSIS